MVAGQVSERKPADDVGVEDEERGPAALPVQQEVAAQRDRPGGAKWLRLQGEGDPDPETCGLG